ncbi:MAG: acyl carrier protein phosphodiesterase [Bacteroidota bacterium]
MNYLAHAYLSFDNNDILIGNFIADTVKGKSHRFSNEIQKGIRLHHLIDDFTDSNTFFKESVNRIDHKFGMYATIIVDMFYDHFLAANWSRFHQDSLEHFAQKVYALILSQYTIMPMRMKRMLPHMMSSNWLVYYRNRDSFKHFFKGLAARTRYAPNLNEAAEEINMHYTELNDDFLKFMDEMIPYVKSLSNY